MLAPLIAQTTASDSITGVAGWMTSLIDALGPVGVGIVIVAETVFPPLPSEVVLPGAGYLAGLGQLRFWSTLLWATIGSVVGAFVLYGAGRVAGAERLGRLAARLPLMSERDVIRAWATFDRWEQPAVFWGRLVPGVRSLVSIPAGARRMPLGRFTLLTAAGSLIWNSRWVPVQFSFRTVQRASSSSSAWWSVSGGNVPPDISKGSPQSCVHPNESSIPGSPRSASLPVLRASRRQRAPHRRPR